MIKARSLRQKKSPIVEGKILNTEEIMTQKDTEQEVITQIQAEIKRLKLSQAAAAKQLEMSPSTLTQLLNGTYAADPKNHIATMKKWLNSRAQYDQTLPEVPMWVETDSAKKVMSALGYAQMAAGMGLIYGGAGIGKTLACEEYQKQCPNVWIATMSPSTASVAQALEELSGALGMKEIAWGAARIQREIIRMLEGTRGLVIIDEAQHLGIQALDELRSIYDKAKIGFAFIGNEAIYTRMTAGKRAPYLDRLFSRVNKRLYLPKVTASDIEQVVNAFGIQDKGTLKYLTQIGQKPGGLRVVVSILQLASLMAGGAVPEMGHIEAAWRDLGL